MAEGKGFDNGVMLLLVTIALAALVDGIDGTIVSIALPEMGEVFNVSAADTSWVITIYFLMMAGLILIFGRMCDKGALKRIIVSGFIVFTIGSGLCAFADSFMILLVFRALQGVGAGMLAASGILIAVKCLPLKMTALGLSISVLGYSVGGACGPMIGGILLQYLGWEWIFLINVPIGLLGVAISGKAVPRDSGFDRSSFDYIGSVLLFVGMVAGLYVVESAPSKGLSAGSIPMILLFLVSITLFIIRQRRVSNPVLDLSLFTRWRTDANIVVFTIVNMCCMGVLYLLPFYIEKVLGYDTLTSGLLICLQAVVTLIVCIPIGKRVAVKGNRHYVILSMTSLVTMSVLLILAGESNLIMIILALIAFGLVWGFGGGAQGNRIVDSVDQDKRGSISPIVSFIIYLGSALGSALYSALFTVGSHSPGVVITDLTADMFMDGFTFAISMGLIVSVIGLLLAWYVREDRPLGA